MLPTEPHLFNFNQMNLKNALADIIPPAGLIKLTRSYDIIGDIAVTIIPSSLEHFETEIAQAILSIHKNVKVVLKRAGTYSGEHRTIPLAFIAGEKRTETLCKEFGIKLLLDLEKVYFSVRSGTERKRIADLVRSDETILVMFSGIAPYPLMISKYSKASSITGVEVNKTAHDYGVKNLQLNKAKNITLIHDDVVMVVGKSSERYDRIIMPFPYRSTTYLECAIGALAAHGTLHFYDFKCSCNFEQAANLVSHQAKLLGRRVLSSKIVVCGHVSPQSYRVCVDAVIE